MGPLKWIITYGCKLGLHCVYKIDAGDLRQVRHLGPLIFYTNHTGMIEAPILYTELAPRPKVTAIGKAELFETPFLGLVMKVWKIIPVRRGESDLEAIRSCVDHLKRGYVLGISPEGKRNKEGILQRAQGGMAVLALHSDSPLQPVAHWGGDDVKAHLKSFRRSPFVLRVGPAFRLDLKGQKATREVRQEMADEMMYQLAMLMPEQMRGAYADLSKATTKWLAFEEGSPSSP